MRRLTIAAATLVVMVAASFGATTSAPNYGDTGFSLIPVSRTANNTWTGTNTFATTTAILSDKGGQVFNIAAYGARCNGSTDDTSALNGAIAAASAAHGGT